MNWLLENTIVAGAGACVVFAACRIFRPRPALAHILWLLVLIKLLCPSVLRVSLPFELPALWSSIETPSTAASSPRLSHRLADLRRGDVLLSEADSGWLPLDLSPDGAVLAATPRITSSPGRFGTGLLGTTLGSWSIRGWVAAIWILGSLGVLASMLLGIWRMQRIRRAGSKPSAWLRSEVEFLAQRLGIDPPRVIVSSRIGSAFVWGLGRPTLMWPTATTRQPDLGKIRSVIAHELAHLRRRDHWTAWLEIASTVALWWHPLMWLSRSSLRLQAELACDAWAIWAVPDARQAYAGALIDAVEHESQAVITVPVLAARPGARRAFEKRLLMILNEDVPRRLSSWAILPVAALSLTVLSGISFAQERQGKKETRRVERRKDADEIRADVLRRVNEQLRKALGEGFQIDRLGEIDRVVKRFVREQQGKDDGRDRPRRLDQRKDKDKKHQGEHKFVLRLHRDGDEDIEILELGDLLEGKLKHLHGLDDTIRKALKNVRAKVEILDIDDLLEGKLKHLHGLDGTIRKALKNAKVQILDLGDVLEGELKHLHGLHGLGDTIRKALEDADVKIHLEDHDGDHHRIIRRLLDNKGGDARIHILRGGKGNAKVHVLRGGEGNAKVHILRVGKGNARVHVLGGDHDVDIDVEVLLEKVRGHLHGHDVHADEHHRIIRRVLGDEGSNTEIHILRGGKGGSAKVHIRRDGKGGNAGVYVLGGDHDVDIDVEALLEKVHEHLQGHDSHVDEHHRIIRRVLGGKGGPVRIKVLHDGKLLELEADEVFIHRKKGGSDSGKKRQKRLKTKKKIV